MDIKIRKAEFEDIPQLEDLMEQFGGVNEKDFLGDRIQEVIESGDNALYVAELDNHLVGYAWIQSYGKHIRSGEITARFNDLFVKEESRKLGVGKVLFANIKKWARENNVKYLQWQAGSKAAAFYEKLGLKGDTKSDLEEHPFYEIEF